MRLGRDEAKQARDSSARTVQTDTRSRHTRQQHLSQGCTLQAERTRTCRLKRCDCPQFHVPFCALIFCLLSCSMPEKRRVSLISDSSQSRLHLMIAPLLLFTCLYGNELCSTPDGDCPFCDYKLFTRQWRRYAAETGLPAPPSSSEQQKQQQ
jgi:hypothetical protein